MPVKINKLLFARERLASTCPRSVSPSQDFQRPRTLGGSCAKSRLTTRNWRSDSNHRPAQTTRSTPREAATAFYIPPDASHALFESEGEARASADSARSIHAIAIARSAAAFFESLVVARICRHSAAYCRYSDALIIGFPSRGLILGN